MNIDKISELGMEKVAADPKELGRKALSKLKGLKGQAGNIAGRVGDAAGNLSKKQLAALAGGTGVAAGAAGKAGYDKLSDEQKEKLKHRLKGATSGSIEGAAGGALGGATADSMLRGGVSASALKDYAKGGAALGAGVGAIAPGMTGYGQRKRYKEKNSSAEELYIDGLQKIASVTGIEPEVLDEAIGMYNENMTKEAQIDDFLDSISEEDAAELLKEAAQTSPELKGKISEIEEEDENEDLANLVQTIEGLDDKEAEKLLEEIE